MRVSRAVEERSRRERLDEWLVRQAARTRATLRRLLLPGSLVVLVVVTVAGVGVGLRQAGVPRESIWNTGEPAAIALAVVSALAYVGYVLVVIGYRRTLRHRDQDRRLYATCRDVATFIERNTTLELADIAVHVWVVRGMRGLRRLERRATFIPRDRPPSPITWRCGKGVLGQAWARDDWIVADLEPLANARTEGEYYEIPRARRFGFTWQEARATVHYKAILAHPLHGGPENARRVIGCLSIDAQAPGGAKELGAVWDREHDTLRAHVSVCEAVLDGG
jgi:hypothetical protein